MDGRTTRTEPDDRAAVDRAGPGPWLRIGSAVAVSLVGAAALLGSRDYPYWTPLGPGPGFFPRWLGGILVVGGLLWLLQVLRASKAETRPHEAGSRQSEAPGTGTAVERDGEAPEYSLPTVLAIVGSLCLLAATLEVLGYQLAMFVFVLFHLLVLGRRRLLFSLVLAVVCSVGVFVAFTRLLTVPLPASSIPFLRELGF